MRVCNSQFFATKGEKKLKMRSAYRENINCIVDYEVYLADTYEFRPFDSNKDEIWDKIIERESRGKYSVWYKKFIKKYYKKKLLPDKYLKKALLVAGCNVEEVDDKIERNEAKEIICHFRKVKKNKKNGKIRCYYKGN